MGAGREGGGGGGCIGKPKLFGSCCKLVVCRMSYVVCRMSYVVCRMSYKQCNMRCPKKANCVESLMVAGWRRVAGGGWRVAGGIGGCRLDYRDYCDSIDRSCLEMWRCRLVGCRERGRERGRVRGRRSSRGREMK